MKRLQSFNLIWVLSLTLAACGLVQSPTPPTPPPPNPTPLPHPTAEPVSAIPAGPVKVTGEFDYSNAIITTYFVQQAVALVDMYAFVTRDLKWEIPIESQTLGFLELDPEAKQGKYFIDLPAKPAGALNDVDNNGQTDAGVQIFATSYWPNLTGGPYSEGDDRSTGWPTYLASVKADSENKDEIIGGKLVVWAPDDQQQFPTGFGPDGLLFTADDPVAAIPAGYSVIDLDQKPFAVSTEAEPSLALYEPKEAAIKDYSKMSYTAAFEALFQSVSTNWAFNGIESKPVDWPALYKKVQPQIAAAEKKKDALAFYAALHQFSLGIPDGHTGLSDSGNLGNQDFTAQTEAGYGFALRELNTGKAIVIFLTPDGPAEAAGMQVGAEVTEWNGKPITAAIGEAQPYSGPFSLESTKRYQQARYLLRTAVGVEAAVTFTNPGGQPQTVQLTSVAERASFARTSIYFGAPPVANNPVDWRVLDSGVGYVAINSYYDDLSLIITLFERALKQFTAANITTLIVDLRFNGGGNPLGLAGFLTDQEIPLGQQESFSETSGKFEPVGVREKTLPNKEQYQFEKIAVLVGPACASACEQEAYTFSQVPGAIVVGMFPSGGIFADVLRGQYELPEGISFQIPTERFTNADGSLFLEGSGVVPTVTVPLTAENVMTPQDVVLATAEDAVLGVDPNDLKVAGGPIIGTAASGKKAFNQQARQLEELAQESYSPAELAQIGTTFAYSVPLAKDQRLLWGWGWCATSQLILNDNYQQIQLEFSVNGQVLDQAEQFAEIAQSGNGLFCKSYYTVVYRWPSGDTQLQTVVTFESPINDGGADYPAGKQTFNYTVTLP